MLTFGCASLAGISLPTRDAENARALQHASDHHLRRKIFSPDLACGAAMARVIGPDSIDRIEDVLHRSKPKKPHAGGEKLAKPSVLRDDRPACCEIASAAVAEPPGERANVLFARDGELAARSLD